jgi:integrase
MATPIKTVLYTSKLLSSGKYPVILRIYAQGKVHKLSLDMSGSKNEWNAKLGRFNKFATNREEKNAVLRQKEVLADKVIQEIVLRNKPFSFDEFKDRFEGRKRNLTVHEFLDQLMHELLTKGSVGNMKKFKQLKGMLLNFHTSRKLIFTDIDYTFLKKFETYLFSRGSKKGNVHFYMRTLRAMINEAIRRDLMDKEFYPFSTQFNKNGYSFSHFKSDFDPKPLSLVELEKVKGFPVREYPHLQSAYDVFMFLFMARGLNFEDLVHLTHDNIVEGRLNYIRKKTGKLYTIKISPQMREIINKYKTEKYLFPVLTKAPADPEKRYNFVRNALDSLNNQLAEIKEIVGATQKITSYTARYSYSNVLIQNNVPVVKLQQALGHSSLATTQHYVSKFSNDEVDKFDELLY